MALQVWLPLNGNINQQGVSNITVTGSPNSWVDGKLGKCARFSGNAANVIYNNTSDFNYTDNFSFALWIKPNYTGSATQYAFTVGRADTGGYGYGLEIRDGYIIGRFGNGNVIANCSSSAWHHVAMTVKNMTRTLYIDGIQAAQNVAAALPTYSDGNGMGIGCFHFSSNIYPCYSDINDFRIYDHALSPREVAELAKGLVLHYPLNREGFGQDNLVPIAGLYTKESPWTTTKTYTDGAAWIPNSAFEATPSKTYTISVQCDGKLSPTHGASGIPISEKPWTFWLYVCNTNTTKSWQTGAYDTPVNLTSTNNNYRKIGNTHVWTYTLSSTQKYISLRTNSYSDGSTPITINWWNIKIEEGDTFTPWIPSTSSELYTALGFNDGIEYDVSGYGHNGTKVGNITYDSDTPRYGTSTEFNGSQSIDIAFNPNSNPTFTIAGWFYHTGGTTYYAAKNTYYTWVCLEGGRYFIYNNNGSPYVGNWTSTANIWQHIVLIHDSETKKLKLYVNGSFVSQIDTDGTVYGSDVLNLGGRSIAEYSGKVSDFRIYATALTADQVKELYNTPVSIANNGTMLT